MSKVKVIQSFVNYGNPSSTNPINKEYAYIAKLSSLLLKPTPPRPAPPLAYYLPGFRFRLLGRGGRLWLPLERTHHGCYERCHVGVVSIWSLEEGFEVRKVGWSGTHSSPFHTFTPGEAETV